MRGLYLNCNFEKMDSMSPLSKDYSETIKLPAQVGDGYLVYSSEEWSNSSPILEVNGNIFIVAGWFIFENKLNDLPSLAEKLLQGGKDVLNDVEAGSFVIYWWNERTPSLLVDPFGLSSHYFDATANKLRVSPFVSALIVDGQHVITPILASVLQKKDHLFGDFTLFDGIERLSPGCQIFNSKDKQKYFSLNPPERLEFERQHEHIDELASHWQVDKRLLPISSGLDSRYLLASSRYYYGFTYGPDNSPEVSIASKFADCFDEYYSYDYQKPDESKLESELLSEMAFGVINPIARLLTNYEYIKTKFNRATAFFDGYLGDLFQRGTYVNFKGAEGELFKIFPLVYKYLNWSGEQILAKRYKQLNDEELELLLNDFRKNTSDLKLDEYQKVTYYEFIYGRGARYTAFGSNVLCAQFFTVVSPFASKKLFNTFIHQDFTESVQYKTMRSIWKKIPEKFRKQPVESGYSPKTPVIFIPFIQIIYRLMFHLIPSRANYGVALNRKKKSAKESS
ncbi:hypothetical protein [Thalassotalea euphylliae]|nr:hypothetical protein [Thalassotalea euphylliae]